MRAIILAAGIGRRMGALTEHTNKVLLPVCKGKGTLDLQIDALREVGLKDEEITIVVGHKSREIVRRYPNCDYIYNDKYSQYNTSYSLYLARERFREGAFLLNGDVICPGLAELLKGMLDKGECLMAVQKKICDEEDMKVSIRDGYGLAKIVKLSKEISLNDVSGEYVGVAYFDEIVGRALCDILPHMEYHTKHWSDWYEAVIQFLIYSTSVRIAPYEVDGALVEELDTPKDLLRILRIWREEKKNDTSM